MLNAIKKIIFLILVTMIMLSSAMVSAGSNGTCPKLIIDDYTIEGQQLTPGNSSTITIMIYNTNNTKSVRNVRLSFLDSADEIIPVKTASEFCPYIGIEEFYTWEIEVYALEIAKDSPHTLSITMEYEDSRGRQLKEEDVIIVDVVQPVRMNYTEPKLPPKVTEGDTFSFSMKLMNMGKTDIYNALLTFDIENITNGSSVFVGTIKEGESKEAKTNFRVDTQVTGDAGGTIVLSYEDSRGRLYEKELPVSTFIQEKVVINQPNEINDDNITENVLVWKITTFVCGGLTIVLLFITIIITVKSRRIKKEYEMKL